MKHRRDPHRLRGRHERARRVARDRRHQPLRRRRLHDRSRVATRARVSSLNLTTGNVNTGFSAGATSHVYTLRVKGNRLYVGGAFSTLAGSAPRAHRRGQHHDRRARPRLQPERERRGPRASSSRPTATPSTSGGDFLNIGGGARGWIAPLSADDRHAAPADVPVPPRPDVGRRTSSTSTSRPSGDRIFAGLGGFENQAVSWSTVTGRRQWGRQVNGDLQAVKYVNGNVYAGFHEGDLGDDTIRCSRSTPTPASSEPPWHLADEQLLRRLGHRRVPGRARLRWRVHQRQRRRDPGRRDPAEGRRPTRSPPTAPTNLRLTGSTANSVSFAWNAGHRQHRRDRATASCATASRSGTRAGLTYTDPDLTAATDFRYEVQSVDSSRELLAVGRPDPGRDGPDADRGRLGLEVPRQRHQPGHRLAGRRVQRHRLGPGPGAARLRRR